MAIDELFKYKLDSFFFINFDIVIFVKAFDDSIDKTETIPSYRDNGFVLVV